MSEPLTGTANAALAVELVPPRVKPLGAGWVTGETIHVDGGTRHR